MGMLTKSYNNYGILLPASVQTDAVIELPDQINLSWKGVIVIINVSDYVDGSYLPIIQGKDPASGRYYNLISSPTVDCNCINQLIIYPGVPDNGSLSVNTILPYFWRVILTSEDSPNMKLSVGYSLII